MSGKRRFPTFAELQSRLTPLVREFSEEIAVALIRSVPLVGPALVIDRNTLRRLSALFESDTEIQRDIDKVVQNMAETEQIMSRLKAHVESRKNDLQQTLDEYNRFKELAAVEKEKAQPLLNELRKEGMDIKKDYVLAECNGKVELVGAVFIKPEIGDEFYRFPGGNTNSSKLEKWKIVDIFEEYDQRLYRFIESLFGFEAIKDFIE